MSKHKNKNLAKINKENIDAESCADFINSGFSELINEIEKWRNERKISNEKNAQQRAELDQKISNKKEKHIKQLEEHKKHIDEHIIRLEELSKKSEINFIKKLEAIAKNNPILQDKIEKFKRELGIDSLNDKYKLQ